MCIANYEASGSQVQLTLERGLPAMIGSFTSQQLPYPSLSFDMIHCAGCGVDWDQKGNVVFYSFFLPFLGSLGSCLYYERVTSGTNMKKNKK